MGERYTVYVSYAAELYSTEDDYAVDLKIYKLIIKHKGIHARSGMNSDIREMDVEFKNKKNAEEFENSIKRVRKWKLSIRENVTRPDLIIQ